jgi:uncharacterized membrane protein YhaH (DUF805 family)
LVWLWTLSSLVMQAISLLILMSGPYGAINAWYIFLTMGWLISLINLAVLVISVLLIYFWIQPGTAGPNEYGPDPLAGAAAPT